MAGFLSKLFGGKAADDGGAAEAIEYKGFRIRPTPIAEGGQYQTAGYIEKEIGGELKSYRFVRVDRHSSREDSITLILIKGQQIIDEQGERVFAPG